MERVDWTERIAKTYYEACHPNRNFENDAYYGTKGKVRKGANAIKKMLIKNSKEVIAWLKEK